MADRDDFAVHMEAVARLILGEPNARLSSGTELRFGSHGSVSVDLQKGTFFDHEATEGGGVLKLIETRLGLKNGGAVEWMRDHGIDMPDRASLSSPAAVPQRSRIVATYDYQDETGALGFQVVRMEPKTFRQRRRPGPGDDPSTIRDGWVWSVKGVRLLPYRLPELAEAIALERVVFIVEGEKDVDALALRGIPATCNPMGAGKWADDLNEHFVGADVVIVPDNDDAGAKHRDLVAGKLAGVAARVRSLDLPGLGPKGDISDWLDAGGSAEELYHLVETAALRPGEAPFRSRYGALWLDEIPGRVSTAPWIVKGLIPARGFGAFVGQPGCGKSFLALDLAFSVAVLARTEGEDARWFGRRVHPIGVAYIAAEGQTGFVKRVEALLKRYRVDNLAEHPFVLIPSSVDLRSDDGDTAPLCAELQALDRRMQERSGLRLGLVFVDTLNRVLAGGDENAPEDMGALIRNCSRLQAAVGGATIVPVHHMNASGTRERGHSSLRGALDFMIEVERFEDGGNRWKVAKQKDEEDGQTFGFSLRSQVIGLDGDGDAITSCLVEPVEQKFSSAARPSRKLPPQALNAYNILFHHCDERGERRFVAGHTRACTTLEAWQRECARQNLVAPGSTDDALRKAFQRAMDTLRAERRIGVEGDVVWPILRRADSS
ncbi:AAA family ATPase [Methylobacterium sp. JK268]